MRTARGFRPGIGGSPTIQWFPGRPFHPTPNHPMVRAYPFCTCTNHRMVASRPIWAGGNHRMVASRPIWVGGNHPMVAPSSQFAQCEPSNGSPRCTMDAKGPFNGWGRPQIAPTATMRWFALARFVRGRTIGWFGAWVFSSALRFNAARAKQPLRLWPCPSDGAAEPETRHLRSAAPSRGALD
jgi:hypothetical protein